MRMGSTMRRRDPFVTPAESPEEELYLEALKWYWGLEAHPVDDRVAVEKFEKSAEAGHPPAQLQMGVFCKCGGLFRKDAAAADQWFAKVKHRLAWFRERAENGDVLAMWQLSRVVAHGLAADADDEVAPSPQLMARTYTAGPPMGPASGTPPPDNDDAAMQWCRLAAEEGYALAQFDLSQCYHDGEGVERDLFLAAEWCQRAATQKMVEASYWLGHYLRDGSGVDASHVEAVKWLRQPAALGHCAAQRLLGFLYTPTRDRTACKWLKNSRDNGSLTAEQLLTSVLAGQQRTSKRRQLMVSLLAPATPSTPQLHASTVTATSPQQHHHAPLSIAPGPAAAALATG